MTEEPSPGAEIVGACHTVTSIARPLDWAEAEVISAGNDLRLLKLTSDDGVHPFPSLQLHDGKIVDGFQDIMSRGH
ncbi:hypothetical protein [Microbacterium sp. NPDC089696]|uniref:hypothetical protein n=1 Tax=Microbacterium sp. NPDC089696 TaxID=3364199 RepID=UPI00382FE689